MKEYITKDRAKQFVCGHCNEVCSEEPCEPSDCDWMAFIDKEPAADVAEVVRCKGCKWYSELACGEGKLLGSQVGVMRLWRGLCQAMDFAALEKGKTMAKEYIERQTLLHKIRWASSAEEAVMSVRSIPAADVVEVRHGRWEFGKDLPDSFGSISKNKYHLYCSECRNQAFNKSTDNDWDFDMDTPFCPWCGAKMDKEAADDKEQPEEAPGE